MNEPISDLTAMLRDIPTDVLKSITAEDLAGEIERRARVGETEADEAVGTAQGKAGGFREAAEREEFEKPSGEKG